MSIQDLPESRKPESRRPTNVPCAPGLPPPMFAYRPAPVTHVKLFAGRVEGVLVEGVRRAPSTKTCAGLHVTPPAFQTAPETSVHLDVDEKSSAAATTVALPEARTMKGARHAPATGRV